MDTSHGWWFGPFHLDLRRATLWRGNETIELRPKDFALLQYLVEHPDRLLRRDDLLDAVWPEAFVGDDVLRGGITRLRRVLGDNARAPRYIATVPRRGYRWLTTPSAELPADSPASPPDATARPVGRETELERLQGRLETARAGQRQLVFLTGAAGMGKTTVVEAFLTQVQAAQDPPLTALGQCVEHYGTGEAYLPVLEALGRLCRGPAGPDLVALLRQRAPTWLAQMPWLLDEQDRAVLSRELLGTTRERMMREMAEALEALTAETPLVLVLEDLHWSDFATLDLLALLTQRRETARLLLIGTYRPEDVEAPTHPLPRLMQTVLRHAHGSELPLSLLNGFEVTGVLETRFPAHLFPPTLAETLYRFTDGQPLYLIVLLDAWVAHGVLGDNAGQWVLLQDPEALTLDIPENLWQMIAYRLERLSPEEQEILEVASVAGVEFPGALVAAGLTSPMAQQGTSVEDVVAFEARCELLARRGAIIERRGVVTWPDGTASTAYGFRHALYREVMYERLSAARCQLLHRRLAARLEAAHGERVETIAGELAMHWQQAGELPLAVRFRQQAARNARGRHAYREAISHLTVAFEILHELPETPARSRQEMTLYMALGAAQLVGKNPSAPEVEHAYARARALCLELGEDKRLAQALYALWMVYTTRGEYPKAQEMGEELLKLARCTENPASLLVGHHALGNSAWWRGEFMPARQHLNQAGALDSEISTASKLGASALMARISNESFVGLVLCVLGYPEEALRRSEEALARARELGHPHALATALDLSANLLLYRREGRPALERAEELFALATKYGFDFWRAGGNILRGWARAQLGRVEEGIPLMHQGLELRRSGGGKVALQGHLVQLADVCWRAGRLDELPPLLAEADSVLAETGECSWQAERLRLEGEWFLGQGAPQAARAEARFGEALALSRRQQARLWELRAAMSLGRLWQRQGKSSEAHRLLFDVYNWYSEGYGLADLRQTRDFLQEVSAAS